MCIESRGRVRIVFSWASKDVILIHFLHALWSNFTRSVFSLAFGSWKYGHIARAAFRILLKGGQNSCFRIPGGASATCCTIQYIYIVKFQGGANIQQGGGGGGANAPPPTPLKKTPAYSWNNLSYYFTLTYVTVFGKTGLIAGLVKIDFFPEKASTKFKYCLRKIWALYIALLSRYDSK